jgi:hypothetical protein
MPTPRVFIVRDAGANRYRSDVQVTVIDVPAFVAGVGGTAAGELAHFLPTLPTWLQRVSKISALEIWLRVHMPNDRRVVAFVKFKTTNARPLFGVSGDIGFEVVKIFGLAVWPLPSYRVGEM